MKTDNQLLAVRYLKDSFAALSLAASWAKFSCSFWRDVVPGPYPSNNVSLFNDSRKSCQYNGLRLRAANGTAVAKATLDGKIARARAIR
jgi:hypothetical protein